MKKYNGFRSWAEWNVSLWLNNSEWLYKSMLYWISQSDNREMASRAMLFDLNDSNIFETPDGAKYTKTTIRIAMRGL